MNFLWKISSKIFFNKTQMSSTKIKKITKNLEISNFKLLDKVST